VTGSLPRAREDDPTPRVPPRPPLVELAAAILIVAGIVGTITAIGGVLAGGTDPFVWLTLGLNAASILLGIATRIGRLWLVTLNFAAVLGFLDILGSAANPQALIVGISEVVVVVLLLLRKPWFDALAEARAARRDAGTPAISP
jgi:hypothetical protein